MAAPPPSVSQLHTQANPSPWGPTFDSVMTNILGQVGQFLQGPGGMMDQAYQPFVQTLAGFGNRSGQNGDLLTDTMTEIFKGMGAMEDRTFELVRKSNLVSSLGTMNGSDQQAADSDTEDFYEVIASFNFYYAGGGISLAHNMTERFAASLNAYCYLVNQAFLTLMKEVAVKIQKGTIREVLSGNLELTEANMSQRTSTIQVETFDEALIHLLGNIRTSFTRSVKVEKNFQALQMFLTLVGIQVDDLGEEALEMYYTEGLLDRCFLFFFLERLLRQNFDFQNEGGNPISSSEFITALIQQSFNQTFNQNVEAHVSNPNLKQKMYTEMLYNFYVQFWSNFIANFLPMVIMDFYNFTHGLALLDTVYQEPFLASLRDLTVGADLEDSQLNFNLKWFNDKSKSATEKKMDASSSGNPSSSNNLSNRAISLTEVFKNYNLEHFKTSLTPAFDHAIEEMSRYTQNADRKTILGSTFSQIFEYEKKFYQFLNPKLSDAEQSLKLVNGLELLLHQHFGVSPALTFSYLKESKKDSSHTLRLLTGTSFSNLYINWTFLVHLLTKWVPPNGIPSFNYYLFNTFLRPYRMNDLLNKDQEKQALFGKKEEEEPLQLDDEHPVSQQQFHLPIQQFFSDLRDPSHLPSIFSDITFLTS